MPRWPHRGEPGKTGPLRMLVGVTGHRDLREEDLAPLRTRLRSVFGELTRLCPHTPIALLSPLAEGADRLAAEVAIAMGIGLVVPLAPARPGDLPDHAGVNDDARSRAEFDRLLAAAESSFLVADEPSPAGGDTPGRGELDGRARLGLVGRCQVLIALWDGVEAYGEGATCDIVHAHRAGGLGAGGTGGQSLDPLETGPVYHIVTPRRSRPAPAFEPFAVRRLDPESLTEQGPSWTSHHRLLLRLEGFNRDACRIGTRLVENRRKYRGHLIGLSQSAQLSAAVVADLELHALANSLSRHFQRRFFRSLDVLLGLSLAWAVTMQAHNLTAQSSPASVHHGVGGLVYLGLFFSGLGYYAWVKTTDIHTRYLDYRALAEALRVRLFWRLAGIRASVADHYLRKQRSELDWIRYALRQGELCGDGDEPGPHGLSLALSRWVADQARYFAAKARRNHAASRVLDWLSRQVFFPIFVLMAILKASDTSGLLVVAMTLSLVVAALIGVYQNVRAFAEHAKQYTRLATLFSRARQRVEALMAAGLVDEAREVLILLGREALVENGDWVLIHRARPIELPRT